MDLMLTIAAIRSGRQGLAKGLLGMTQLNVKWLGPVFNY
jgi:hypothetical protein